MLKSITQKECRKRGRGDLQLHKNMKEIANYFSSKATEKLLHIQRLGLILYSSLDSCDMCQDELIRFFQPSSEFSQKMNKMFIERGHTVTENPSWLICYFSTLPCKKSSYTQLSRDVLTHFTYNKEKEKFFLKTKPLEAVTFSCAIEGFDLSHANDAPILWSYIKQCP